MDMCGSSMLVSVKETRTYFKIAALGDTALKKNL
jgi:hypothetical protein